MSLMTNPAASAIVSATRRRESRTPAVASTATSTTQKEPRNDSTFAAAVRAPISMSRARSHAQRSPAMSGSPVSIRLICSTIV